MGNLSGRNELAFLCEVVYHKDVGKSTYQQLSYISIRFYVFLLVEQNDHLI